MSERNAWAQGLKAGDKVISLSGYYSDPTKYGRLHTVTRITKTQVILESGSRFNRNTGLLVGGRASDARLYQATTGIIDARRAYKQHRLMLAQVRKVDLAILSLSQLSRIFDIIVEEQ